MIVIVIGLVPAVILVIVIIVIVILVIIVTGVCKINGVFVFCLWLKNQWNSTVSNNKNTVYFANTGSDTDN